MKNVFVGSCFVCLTVFVGINECALASSHMPPLVPLLLSEEVNRCDEELTPTTFQTSVTLPTSVTDNWAPGVDLPFAVTGFAGVVNRVTVNITISDLGLESDTEGHSLVGDLTLTLESPNGTTHTIFQRTGKTQSNEYGYMAHVVGPYSFSDRAEGNWWLEAEKNSFYQNNIPSGAYRTSAPVTGAITSMDKAFACEKANGVWTLNISDNSFGYWGAFVTDVSLVLE